jgi:ferredoxin
VVRDGAVVFEPISSADELPAGVRDIQGAGSYRLERSDTPRCFAWANGPQALKPLTFAPEESMWRVTRNEAGLHFEPTPPVVPPSAVIGVRGCDLAALQLQEAHFLDAAAGDTNFRTRREALFIVAVDCAHPADTCFCASTGDGPGAENGFDIAISELDEGLLLRSGSVRGERVINTLGLAPAGEDQLQRVRDELRRAAESQSRGLPSRDLRDPLFARQDHAHWTDVAQRCLACGNCTAVCPTCFCSSYEARPELDGDTADHLRQWDSCFDFGHSSLHGHPMRDDIRLRYRQWLTHKLAGWHDQFGRSGCTGCGRCITWCPVGIDLTAEVAALLEGESL